MKSLNTSKLFLLIFLDYLRNSRANAPTGSAGEESVSSLLLSSLLLLLLLLLLNGVLLAHTSQFLGACLARAPRAAHMRKGVSGAHKLSQNHGIYDVFAASEKTKIKDKDSEKAKTLYFTMFLACRVRKLAFRKVPITVFCTPTHQRQNNAIYDVFLLSQPQNRAETSVFTMFLQHQKKPA